MALTAKMMVSPAMGDMQSQHTFGIAPTPQEAPKMSPLECLFPQFQRRRYSSSSSYESNRRVTFSPAADVKIVKDLRVDYKEDLWMSQKEMDTAKLSVARLMKALEKKGITLAQCAAVEDQDSSVFMGLEKNFSKKTRGDISIRQRSVYDAVLTEQRRQRLAAVHNPDKLADVSAEQTAYDRRRARIIGLIHCGKK
mmetsp:Transcript_37005/g.62942  ORF Transcript_37005/g.62942 Transcript_37005/m.62942 type:complete len:196 (-) Transcript_37005:126-713(-)